MAKRRPDRRLATAIAEQSSTKIFRHSDVSATFNDVGDRGGPARLGRCRAFQAKPRRATERRVTANRHWARTPAVIDQMHIRAAKFCGSARQRGNCPIRDWLRVRGSVDRRTRNWLRTASRQEIHDKVKVPDEIQKDLSLPGGSVHPADPASADHGSISGNTRPFPVHELSDPEPLESAGER